MVDDLQTLEAELGDRLRHTLRAVADAVEMTEVPELPRRRWRRIAGVLAAVVALGGAAAFMAQNDDAIVRLPVEEALMSGKTAAGDWWLFPTDAVVSSECPANPGVVLVAGEINRPGQELNAGGVVYGNPQDPTAACSPYDEDSWLQDPSRTDIGHSRLGFERNGTPWGVYGTFHPTVTAIRVQADDAAPFVVETVPREDAPGGPRYAAFSLPSDTTVARIELLDAAGTILPVEDPDSADELLRTFG